MVKKKIIGVSGISIDTSYDSHQLLHSDTTANLNTLTHKQSECLQYLITGKTAKEIAKILNVSYRTIEHRIAALKSKFSCNKISELIYKATYNTRL